MAKNKIRKEVLGIFTGIMFEVRRVRVYDYMQELKDLPFKLAPATIEELDKIKDALEKLPPSQVEEANRRTQQLFLSRGIVRMKYPGDEAWSAPNIWFGDEAQCPDDFITIADLGTDGDLIAQEIAQYSFNPQGVKALEGFFRGNGQQPAGPDSEAVRSETVNAPAERHDTA